MTEPQAEPKGRNHAGYAADLVHSACDIAHLYTIPAAEIARHIIGGENPAQAFRVSSWLKLVAGEIDKRLTGSAIGPKP